MKIKTKTLTTFLKKFMMQGPQQIKECILHFEKEGLKINANSPASQARTVGWLKTVAFKEYEEIANVGVNDLDNIVKVLGRFGEMITLTVEGNLLTVKGNENKQVQIELVAENFLSTDTGEPNLTFEETFIITADKIKEIIDDVSVNKDAIITVETQPKKVIFKNAGKYKFTNEILAPTVKGGIRIEFGEPLINAVASLDGNLEISARSDYPMKIMEKTDDMVITILVAPRVEDASE